MIQAIGERENTSPLTATKRNKIARQQHTLMLYSNMTQTYEENITLEAL